MMSVEKFLNFFINQNILLIESLTLLIVLFAAYLAYRSFAVAKEEELNPSAAGAGGADLSKMEEMIKKLLEQANKVPSSGAKAGAAGVAAGDDSALLQEIEAMKKELAEKANELEKVRLAAQAAGASAQPAPGISSEEKSRLEAKLKDLEGKLKEYEIISEDIADLSFYKEENSNLKKQLESLKGNSPAASAESSAPSTGKISISVSDTVVEPPAATEAIAAAPANPEPVSPAPAPEPTPAPTTVPPATSGPEVVAAPVVASPEPAAVAPVAAAPAAAPSAAASLPEKTGQVDEDILNEFNQALEEAQKADVSGAEASTAASAAATEKEEAAGAFDIDKMVAEATDLKVPEGDAVNSLDQAIDPDKLAAEAGGMDPVSDDDKKLMGQFENFVKKEK